MRSALHEEHQYDLQAQQEATLAHAAEHYDKLHTAEQDYSTVDRRTILKGGAALLVVSAIDGSLADSAKGVAEWTGEQIDNVFWQAETIMPNPVTALDVRVDSTPVVAPKLRGVATTINPSFSDGGVLRFAPNTVAEAEHVPYQDLKLGEGIFATAGVGVLTTAEGLVDGKQEFAEIFEDKTTGQVVAVGFEGGLYAYKTEFGKPDGTSGEWVRIVTRPDKNSPPSPLVSRKTWGEMQAFMPEQMMIQRIEQGSSTLQRIGYQAFGAVLPNTKMPEAKAIQLGPENCVGNYSDVTAGTHKDYLVTAAGDILGMTHLGAKAEETLTVYTQLLYQTLTDEQNPIVRINYTRGSGAYYEFAIDPSSLTMDNLTDMTSSIMDTMTLLMEGLTQRGLYEKVPDSVADLLPAGHFSSEDPFTNTLAKNTVLEVINEFGVTDMLIRGLRTLHDQNPSLPVDKMPAKIQTMLTDLAPQLIRMTVDKVVADHGIRPQTEQVTLQAPLGIYHNIPTKADVRDAATPTRIDKQKAGIRPKNAAAHRYQTTNIPVVKAMLGHAVSKLAH